MSYQRIHQSVPKRDAYAIMSGAGVYTEDLVSKEALAVEVLRSPHAFAKIVSVDKSAALADPNVVCVLTWEDVPRRRYSAAGASCPGNNPRDRYILEDTVRYVGDAVAIVAAKTPAAAKKACKALRVTYEVLPAVLDYETAEGNPSVIHPETDYEFQMEIGGDPARNLISSESCGGGDFEAEYAASPYQLDETYYTCPTQQAPMETFRTYSYMDEHDRLTLVSSTQVPFHARREVARSLDIEPSRVRVIKPRIGGGFGAKQTMVSEFYPAVVTWLTGKSAYYCMSRRESFCSGNTRHAMRIRVRLGASRDGTVRALWVDTLENGGAYAEHSVNVLGLSGHKTLPLYAHAAAWRFTGRSVYTNLLPGGAFRGFGATQGCFAVESAVNRMADELGLDPNAVRLKNMPREGEVMPAYFGEVLQSTALERCISRGQELFGWAEKRAAAPFAREVAPHRYRGAGMAVTMQGSGIAGIDTGSVRLTLEDGGFYQLSIGATDMGTGCDTILAQFAAEVLNCPVEKIAVDGVDTAHSPYDPGSYASATTYITGNAVIKAAEALLPKLCAAAAESLGVDADAVDFDGDIFRAGDKTLSLYDLSYECCVGRRVRPESFASHSSPTSPPPFAAAFAEVEVDALTGEVTLCDLTGVLDCGTTVNPALARVQAEGGYAQGAGMALWEDTRFTSSGHLIQNDFMNYHIPSRLDLPEIRIEFEESYEPTGPFGAKSIGEVVANTPAPAIIAAIRNAVGADIRSLPATAEKVLEEIKR